MCAGELAPATRIQISREGDHRREIQRRNRSNKRQSGRRLIQPLNTRFDNNSAGAQ